MPKDVVCGTVVSERTDLTSTYQGRIYYFCSVECKEEFDINPPKYYLRDID